MHRLSRTVDAKQDMPGIRVRCPRAEAVALHFLRKLFQRRVRPRLMMTDKLSSSGAAEVEITPGTLGAPMIAGALASIDCRLHSLHAAGDHDILIGRGLNIEAAPGDPLIYCQGRFLGSGD